MIEGRLFNDQRFCTGLFDHNVKGTGGALRASVSPNPLNPAAVLTFATQKEGFVKVQLFDLHGRLIRTLTDESRSTAGYHDVRIDGADNHGRRLASGIYFVRIVTEHDGTETKNITILK